MKAKLIRIGRSLFVKLPRSVAQQFEQAEKIELDVRPNGIAIRQQKKVPRAGWAEACKAMAEAGDDELIDGPLPSLTSFDEEEWEW